MSDLSSLERDGIGGHTGFESLELVVKKVNSRLWGIPP